MKPEKHGSEEDSYAPLKEEKEESRNKQDQEMKQRCGTRGQDQKDTLCMTITDMTNDRLPPFGKLGQPQRQYDPDYDPAAQRDLADHEQFVNEVIRMQEAAIREQQKSNS